MGRDYSEEANAGTLSIDLVFIKLHMCKRLVTLSLLLISDSVLLFYLLYSNNLTAPVLREVDVENICSLGTVTKNTCNTENASYLFSWSPDLYFELKKLIPKNYTATGNTRNKRFGKLTNYSVIFLCFALLLLPCRQDGTKEKKAIHWGTQLPKAEGHCRSKSG